MKTNSRNILLCTSALTGALVLGSSLQACRSTTSDLTSSSGSGGAGGSTSQTGTGGVGGSAQVQVVTIQQIADPTAPGHLGSMNAVTLKGVVAMSIPFLVSKSSSGACLWGVFVTSPNLTTTAPYTGLLALGEGTPASVADGGTKAYCPTIQPYPPAAGMPSGSPFPDDTLPGDVFDITGTTDAYISSECSAADAGAGSSNVASIQLSSVTVANRTSRGAPLPAPYVLSLTDLAALASGNSATWLDQWGSVLVQAPNVGVTAYEGSLTDTYGHMYLGSPSQAAGIQVGDKLYYVGYVEAVNACYDGPSFTTYSPSFTSITGFVYLDYCNWGLSPRDKCHNLVPPSLDCASVVYADGGVPEGGPDGGGPNLAHVCVD